MISQLQKRRISQPRVRAKQKKKRKKTKEEQEDQIREYLIIERQADPDAAARKYADRQLFKRVCCGCCLEYRLPTYYRALLRSYHANQVNYRLTNDSAAAAAAAAAIAVWTYETDVSNENTSKDESPNESSNMEYGQSTTKKYVCSKCGSSPPIAIKIEERVEESTTYEIIEENHVESSYESSLLRYQNDDPSHRRVPFPEAGVDIIDRKLKNTKESLEREINEYRSHDDDILTYSESWTENWLFRKKDNNNLKNTNNNNKTKSFKPVSMFVPNPKSKDYCRAMIGDRNADEISDLSDDCCSDGHEEDEETRKDGNGMAKYIYDRSAKLLLDSKSSKHHSKENGYCHDDKPVAIDRLDGHEYTGENEMLDWITTPSNRSYRSELFIESVDVNQNFKSDNDDKSLSDIDFHLFSPPKPGTIADREHRKWQTAVPLKNNPYSEENLQKRLLERKYKPKYSNGVGLLGIARINSVDDKVGVDSTTSDMIDFELIDYPTKKSSTSIVTNKPCENSIIVKSVIVKKSQSNGITHDADNNQEASKNKSNESKVIEVTKNNATIVNEVDCSEEEEKISLPSVKKLVEVFTMYQRDRKIIVPKDKNTTTINEMMAVETKRRNFQRIQPRPLHLHSLTARSLSKEFREGLR